MKSARITPVILSGGAGTRLWPLSRADHPKQFLPLLDGKSTLAATLARVADSTVYSEPLILTSHDSRFMVAEELRQANQGGQIVMEPVRRDSAPAIAVGALLSEGSNPGGLVLVLAADHLVTDTAAFSEAVQLGCASAEQGYIVTFGIKPDRPSSAYGYIEPGRPIAAGVHIVSRFLEKPDERHAQALIDQGCLWNSGNFLFRSDVFLAELESFEPEMLKAVRGAVRTSKLETQMELAFRSLGEAAFAAAPAKSVDYAVMEHTKKIAVVKADYGWSDLGSYATLWDALEKDANGNVTSGTVTLQGINRSFVAGQGLPVIAIGQDNMAIVATQHGVLVAPLNVGAEIKPLLAALQASENDAMHARQTASENGRATYQATLLKSDRARLRQWTLSPGGTAVFDVQLAGLHQVMLLDGNCSIVMGSRNKLLECGLWQTLGNGGPVHVTNDGDCPASLLSFEFLSSE